MFQGGNTSHVTSNQIALTVNSLMMLGIDTSKAAGRTVMVTPATPYLGKFMFYWNHPIHMVRLTFKLGIWGLIVAAIVSVPGYLPLFQRLLHLLGI